jgi:ring-1,2-phenylacetyl-CoA epoxidase subunit PaaE
MSDKVLIGDHSDKAPASGNIIATIDGETVEATYTSGESILDALIKAGHTPPYSCMAGSCMACMAKIEEGQVYQEDEGILGPDNIDNNESLTCQAHPLTETVKVVYEEE